MSIKLSIHAVTWHEIASGSINTDESCPRRGLGRERVRNTVAKDQTMFSSKSKNKLASHKLLLGISWITL